MNLWTLCCVQTMIWHEYHPLQLFALFQIALREPLNLHWLHKVLLTFNYAPVINIYWCHLNWMSCILFPSSLHRSSYFLVWCSLLLVSQELALCGNRNGQLFLCHYGYSHDLILRTLVCAGLILIPLLLLAYLFAFVSFWLTPGHRSFLAAWRCWGINLVEPVRLHWLP